MTIRMKEVSDNEWSTGKYKVRKAQRYNENMIVSDAVKSLGPDIYHIYFDGKYLAQRTNFQESKKYITDHKEKNK